MTAANGPNGSYPNIFQTTPGVYGSLPSMPNIYYPTPNMHPQDTFQRQQSQSQQSQQPTQPWYLKVGKEVLKTGVIIGASVLGGIVGNVPGAMVAGAVAAGLVSVTDQKLSNGKVNWGSAFVDTAIGLIPAGLGGSVIKGVQSLTGKALFGAAGKQSLRQVITKGATIGAMDGAAMGYAGGLAHTAMDSYQRTGQANWSEANQSGLEGVIPGAFGGAVAGGAVSGLVRHFSAKSNKKATAKESAPQEAQTYSMPGEEELKTLKPPKRSLFNRIIGFISLRSEDKTLGNFHKVDAHVLRGAMPESAEAFAHLKNHHNVRTIIDLRGAHTTKADHIRFEMGHAAANDIHYVHLPMNSHVPPTQAELRTFLKAIEDTRLAGGKTYVHCKHGIDRTGVLVAAYEVANGKSPEAAFKNMRKYGYNLQHEWSRPEQKSFVLGEALQQTLKAAQGEA